MDIFTLQQKKYVIKQHHLGHSIRDIVRLFHNEFQQTICFETVRHIINNFEKYGCLNPRKHKKEKVLENEQRDVLICAAVETQPQMSSQNIAEQLDVSATTVRSVLKKCKYRSYKLQKSNEMFPDDKYERVEFCERIIEQCNNDDDFIKK